MNLKLVNKVALVSGSTAGIGLAITIALAQQGATIIINGRTTERVNAAIARIKQIVSDAKLKGTVADLETQTGVSELFEQVPKVDILVNNLGIYGSKAFDKISDREWMKFLKVNVIS